MTHQISNSTKRLLSSITIAATILALPQFAAGSPDAELAPIELKIQKSLNKYCIECHNEDKKKGKLRLDNFTELANNLKSGILGEVEEQLFLEEMPPEDEELQPTTAERSAWLATIKEWNDRTGAKSLLSGKKKTAAFGNLVDNDKLFSGEFKDQKGFTYDREWIVSEYIFAEKINELIRTNDVRGRALPEDLSNPFLLTDKAGVRYYANRSLNSSQFVSMLGNAPHIARGIVNRARQGSRSGGIDVIREMIAEDDKLNTTLKRRETFLENFADRVCEDLYQGDNDALLPSYEPIALKENRVAKKDEYKKTWEFGYVPKPDGPVIYWTLKELKEKNLSNLEMLRACEKEWRSWGVPDNVVQRRVETLRKYMAFALTARFRDRNGPPKYQALSKDEMQIVHATIKKVRKKGMSYNALVSACMAIWKAEFQEIRNCIPIKEADVTTLVNELHQVLYQRPPSTIEAQKCAKLFYAYAKDVSKADAIMRLIEMLVLRSEFTVRSEIGSGQADEQGRRMLSPRDASYAIAYALTDSLPDAQLVKAAEEGRLNTREDYKREVQRLLSERQARYRIETELGSDHDGITTTPIRKLRFFREFFGYDNALAVFKDDKRLAEVIGSTRQRLVVEADMLVDDVLQRDEKVFEELLTTEEFFVLHSKTSNKAVKELNKQASQLYQYFAKHDWRNFTQEDLSKHKKAFGKAKVKFTGRHGEKMLALFKMFLTEYGKKWATGKNAPSTFLVKYNNFLPSGRDAARGMSRLMDQQKNLIRYYVQEPENWVHPSSQPAKVANRKGILTHPAWLQAFSQNTHTDPVTRGKWVREKLLAGLIPDVPIGVEAVIPEDHTKTLRHRLAMVTEKSECWRCHKLMNPLGNAFEMYDDFGRFRLEEELEHPKNVLNPRAALTKNTHKKDHYLKVIRYRTRYKAVPMDSSGSISLTSEPELHGEVKDAHDMIDRLVRSELVRQSIIRHAFRYFMGRNEMLSDSKTLIDADQAYLSSGGSFDAVIVSLLTSDSFIYRKKVKE